MDPLLAYALTLILFALFFAAGWAVCNDLKDRRAERAEATLRALRAVAAEHQRTIDYLTAYPPTPCVQRVELINPHPRADAEKECIRVLDTARKPITLAFTDASYLAAKVHGARVEADLAEGRARILP